jgi:uncharacterized protein YegL
MARLTKQETSPATLGHSESSKGHSSRRPPPLGDAARDDVPARSFVAGLVAHLVDDTETQSFLCSMLLHITVLLGLACLAAENPSDKPIPLVLTFNVDHVENPDVSLEPIAEIEPEMPESQGNPNPEQQTWSNSFLEGTIQEAFHESAVTVSTAPEFLFAEESIEAVPDTEILLAEVLAPEDGRKGKGRSHFGDEADGGELTSFFGIRASGNAVVYVVDCSSSMRGAPLQRLKQELIDSIRELPPRSRFTVIFFNSGAIAFDGKAVLLRADPPNKAKVIAWVSQVQAEGGTDPSTALGMALGIQPSVVFLMTDGVFQFPFDQNVMAMVANAPKAKTRINTIAFGAQAAANHLQTIAKTGNGSYAFVRVGNP